MGALAIFVQQSKGDATSRLDVHGGLPRRCGRGPATPRHASFISRTQEFHAKSETTIIQCFVFLLAGFVGFRSISRIPPLLHTPLMAAANAISGISLVASMVLAGARESLLSTILGCLAVAFAMANVGGGFLTTGRMLAMFKRTNADADGKSTATRSP